MDCCKPLALSCLTLALSAVLSGCVTTQTMPDGTTKVKFTDDVSRSLQSALPSAMTTGATGSSANGVVDLSPTVALNDRGLVFLDNQFNFDCMAGLLYTARSGKPMSADWDRSCSISYVVYQNRLKMAGKQYDPALPELKGTAIPAAYWNTVKSRTIARLSSAPGFKVRWQSLSEVEKNGQQTVRVHFLDSTKAGQVELLTNPVRTAVSLPGPLQTKSVHCEAALAFNRTLDRGPRPANRRVDEYAPLVVEFKVENLKCDSVSLVSG